MKYRLRLDVRIDQIDDHGSSSYGQGGLQVVQDLQFEAATFLEIAHILGKFHELAQEIKAE